MSPSEIYNDFIKTAEKLLEIMNIENSYLKESKVMLLDSLLQKKTELFESNKYFADLLFEVSFFNKLEMQKQKNAKEKLEKITLAIQENIDLLKKSSKGNKKNLDLFFKANQKPPVFYAPNGKLLKSIQKQSLGIQYAY